MPPFDPSMLMHVYTKEEIDKLMEFDVDENYYDYSHSPDEFFDSAIEDMMTLYERKAMTSCIPQSIKQSTFGKMFFQDPDEDIKELVSKCQCTFSALIPFFKHDRLKLHRSMLKYITILRMCTNLQNLEGK